jgi:hypothetical protein
MRYITTAEVAKMIRKDLKDHFPGVKFSVRSDHGSISIHYTDGVEKDLVNDVVKQYEGAGFDGSIDLQYYKDHYLLPDGSICLASNSGSESSGGCVPHKEYPKPPGAEEVNLGVKYVFVTHNYSTEAVTKAVEAAAPDLCVQIYPAGDEYWSGASWSLDLSGMDFYQSRAIDKEIHKAVNKGFKG